MAVSGKFAYTATMRKGVHVIDLEKARGTADMQAALAKAQVLLQVRVLDPAATMTTPTSRPFPPLM